MLPIQHSASGKITGTQDGLWVFTVLSRTLSCLAVFTAPDGAGFAARAHRFVCNEFIPLAPSVAMGAADMISDRAADMDSYYRVDEGAPGLNGPCEMPILNARSLR